MSAHQGDADALQAIADLRNLGVIEDNNLATAVWQAAGTLKAKLRRVSLADCFALDLAHRLNGRVLTADHHEFDALAGNDSYRITFIR